MTNRMIASCCRLVTLFFMSLSFLIVLEYPTLFSYRIKRMMIQLQVRIDELLKPLGNSTRLHWFVVFLVIQHTGTPGAMR